MNMDTMRRATALVRDGRLADATALLRGQPAPDARAAPRTKRARAKSGMARHSTACAAGTLDWRLHVPATVAPRPALVVMLHGCTQTPEDFAIGTAMNRLADAHAFTTVWPEQTALANANRCWNWFDPRHQSAQGEAGVLRAVIADALNATGGDPARVFVAGMSAGGAMATALAASCPADLAGIGVHSGLPAGAAGDMPGAFAAMAQGGGAPVARPVPAIVIHGTADRTVNPRNGDRIAAPIGEGPPRLRRAIRTLGGRRTTVTRIPAHDGHARAEHWAIEGLGHAWSGGDPAGSHTDAAGPDASAAMVRFFGLWRT